MKLPKKKILVFNILILGLFFTFSNLPNSDQNSYASFPVDNYADSETDTTSPIGTISINSGAMFTNKSTVNLQSSVSDNQSSVILMRVATSTASLETTEWEAYSETKIFMLAGEDGVKFVYAQFKDEAGNISEIASDSIILDTTSPILAVNAPVSGKHIRKTLKFSATVSDPTSSETSSGINKIKVFRDSALVKTITSSYFISKIDTTKIKDGKHVIKLYATDKAGNSRTWAKYYFTDNTKPRVLSSSISPILPSVATNAKLFYKASDNLAPRIIVSLQILKLNQKLISQAKLGKRVKRKLQYKSIKMPTRPEIYVFRTIVKDYAGNQAKKDIKFTLTPHLIKRGNPNNKKVALTIDDGWNSDNRILDLLKKHRIKITVFVIGGRGVAEKHPSWVKRMHDMGFEVANHTYDHYTLTRLSDSAIKRDIIKGQEIITNITGKKYPYMRPSGGSYNKRVLDIVANLGYKMILWSNDLGGYRKSDKPDDMVKNVLSDLKNGDIILSHFGGYNTYNALVKLIPEIKKRGYKITTVTDVLLP